MADKRAAQQAEIDAAQREAQVKARSSLLVEEVARRAGLRWLDRRGSASREFCTP